MGVMIEITLVGETIRPFKIELLAIFLAELMEKALEGLIWSLHLTLLVFFVFYCIGVSSWTTPLSLFLAVVMMISSSSELAW